MRLILFIFLKTAKNAKEEAEKKVERQMTQRKKKKILKVNSQIKTKQIKQQRRNRMLIIFYITIK